MAEQSTADTLRYADASFKGISYPRSFSSWSWNKYFACMTTLANDDITVGNHLHIGVLGYANDAVLTSESTEMMSTRVTKVSSHRIQS